MAKVLGQAGTSLADVYDVVGSEAGVENLESKDVHLVHEMGSTIFNERLSARIVQLEAGALAQTITFNIGISFTETSRVLGIRVISNNSTRISRALVSIGSPPAVDNSDIPVWGPWEGADGSKRADVLISGSIVTEDMLTPGSVSPPDSPNLLIGFNSPRPASTITLRGLTTTFGAGTVTITAIIFLAFPQVQGLDSTGLPIPSW